MAKKSAVLTHALRLNKAVDTAKAKAEAGKAVNWKNLLAIAQALLAAFIESLNKE